MTKDEYLICVAAPHFVAGFIVRGGRVVKASPVLRYMIGWSERRALDYVCDREWEAADEVRRSVQEGNRRGPN